MNADRLRIWFLVSVMGLILLGSVWIFEVMRRNSELADTKQARVDPDYYVEHFNFVRLSQSGKTNYRVSGEKLTHFPKENEFEIIKPLIVSVDQDKTPMRIVADRAIVKQKVKEHSDATAEDQIHLVGNVELERSQTNLSNHIIIKSPNLILFPDSEKMKTQAEIHLMTPRATMRAIGMEADNIEQKIQLLSQVKLEIDTTNLSKAGINSSPKK